MSELQELVSGLRSKAVERGCSVQDIVSFCDKADVLIPAPEASFEEEEDDYEDAE